MNLRPLGTVKEIVEAAGMNISYAYEDLVYLDNNALLLQFADKNTVLIHMNKDADQSVIKEDVARLQGAAASCDLTFKNGTIYKLSQEDDENIRIEFF